MTVDVHLWADSVFVRALTVLLILTSLYFSTFYLVDRFVIKTYPFITTSQPDNNKEEESHPSPSRLLQVRKEAFYLQYNNSSQFLRRDSFAVNET